MTNLPRLYVVMLRYRVAAMVALFMLLGAAREGPLELGARYLLAALALASSYVAATALNDLADEEIDRVNHPRDAGRPLVEGTATRRELLVLHLVASAAAMLAAAPLGTRAVGLIAASLLISQLYSARPVRLSYRVAGAPLALGVAYVLVPYSLGIVAAGGDLRHAWSWLAGALFLLFAARIGLKDFRDREGDALYGKPTILLRFGKKATCATSLCALAAADGLLAVALAPALVALVQPFVLAIAWMLRALWRAGDRHAEQVAIGIGARMGNGLLLGVLSWLVAADGGASVAEASLLTGAVSALFFLGFASLAAHPQEAVIGYKG
ncbi:MAG TPA: UbiA family prenyltransferase [Gaiellaceae bacterium]